MIINQSVTVGLPVTYTHWSFGAAYLKEKESYTRGLSGLSYELIINSDPCIAYLMENNTMALQTLVLAHASVGHSSFFKNNYLFKEGISAKYIIPFMNYAAKYVELCEKKYGITPVTHILDCAHSLANNSYLYNKATTSKKDMERHLKYNDYLEENYNEIYKSILSKEDVEDVEDEKDTHVFHWPEANLLYFIEKMSPNLSRWEREILRIVRMMSQYFYPQTRTKMMNEGYATFWHYTLMYDLYDEGYISEGTMLEILDNHCGVCSQPANRLDYKFNPYKLGSEIFFDIKRICLTPTEEDRFWFPEIAGSNDWVQAVESAMRNFNDESFVLQYLSPHLIRKLGLMRLRYNSVENFYNNNSATTYTITEIASDEDFKSIRKHIANIYSFHYTRPYIAITDYVDDRLYLTYNNMYGHTLHAAQCEEVFRCIEALMECDIEFKTIENEESE